MKTNIQPMENDLRLRQQQSPFLPRHHICIFACVLMATPAFGLLLHAVDIEIRSIASIAGSGLRQQYLEIFM